MNINKVGVFKLTSLVAGNMIGSGVLLAPAVLAPYGSMSIIGWAITTIGALGLAMVFSYLSIWIPKSGGPYTFVTHVFGKFAGFQMAWGYWLSAVLGSVSLITGTIQYASLFAPDWFVSKSIAMIFGITLIWIFTVLNVRGTVYAISVEVLILFIKIAPLILIALAGFCCVDFQSIMHNLHTARCSTTSFAPMASVMLWAFIGLESATVPTNCIDNPKRSVPIATIAGVIITALIYIGGAIAINGLIQSDELLVSQAPYTDAGYKIFGNWGKLFMAITGIAGIAGSLNGWILIQGQMPLAAAKENVFPQFFAEKNHGNAGLIIGSTVMSIVFVLTYQKSLLQHVELMIDAAVFTMLVPYFYCVIAFFYTLARKRKNLSKLEHFWLSLAGTIACIYSVCAIFCIKNEVIVLGFAIFLLSVPFYCLLKQENS